jgi:hypothetical protein
MGLLSFFAETPGLRRLPSGSFTVDRQGQIVASTLSASFPEAHVKEIGAVVLRTFSGAEKLGLPLSEIIVHFAALKITARELRGGAIIFLAPKPMGAS